MKGHQVALWAGVAAFFGSLLTISIVDVLNPDQLIQYLGSLAVAFITAGSVYAKQRFDDAKEEKEMKSTSATTFKKPGGEKDS